MRKVIFAAAVVAIFGISAQAAQLDNGDFTDNMSGWNIEKGQVSIENETAVIHSGEETLFTQTVDAEEGYYDLTAKIKSDSTEGICYLYGKGAGYTMASTSVPKSDSGETVVVRGIGARNGKLDLGIYTDGKAEITMDDVVLTKADKPYTFYKGADITELTYVEDNGGTYKNQNGDPGDAVGILKNYGVNMARIRLYNNPGKGRGFDGYYLPEGYQNEEDCMRLARRAKDAGMAIQFTFHYSDYWSNGERQLIPADWQTEIEGLDREAAQKRLSEMVYSYTKDVMEKLKAQGTTPEYVSLGNEINGGLLFPYGNTFETTFNGESCPKDWNGLAMFINAGYEAVKEISPETQVVIHLADAPKESVFTWFIDALNKAGGKFDVIGASYYPAWSNKVVADCTEFCNSISQKYNKDILIMETGYNWNKTRADGYPGQLTDIDAYKDIYPPTKAGHKGFLTDLFNGLKKVDGGRCIGDIYWDPVMIHCDGVGWAYKEADDSVDANVVENTALFDFDGVGIPSLDVFKNNRNSEAETFKVTVNNGVYSVENLSRDTQKVVLYKASYDKNKILTDVSYAEKDIQPGETKELSVDMEGDNIIAYLWNGNMIPII